MYSCVRSLQNSPAETSDFCRPELWRVRQSRLLLIRSSSLWGGGWSCVDSSSPSGFHVLNWKRAENPPVAGAGADGSDRKLLPELRKVQAASWGCVHEKVTLPWRTTEAQRDLMRAASRWSVWVVESALVSRIRRNDRSGKKEATA